MQNAVNPEELLLAILATTFPCLLFDYLLQALQDWQRKRAGIVDATGFGLVSRTIISLIMNGIVGALIAYLYRLLGTEQQDAFTIGAILWLLVSIPVMLTSKFVDDGQKQVLASRILGWLVKVAIASTAAALIVTKGG
jgi:peptidoglycan/LPS O-acetylase OafA/YrhL